MGDRRPMASSRLSRQVSVSGFFQGLWEMGLFLLKVMPNVFFGGGGR
jgi:hypothetical protein